MFHRSSWLSMFAILGSGPLLGQTPFTNSTDQVPINWAGPRFDLSDAYPGTQPPAEAYPWLQHDFQTDPAGYISAVLAYIYEGNRAVDWVVQNNAVRKWFHAPGMAVAGGGREFIHGLTPERRSRPGELHPNQTSMFQNWAVGFYNAPGGWTTGQVWQDPDRPDASKAVFPVGTVAAKILFTAATVNEVPYLEGAPEWAANINRDVHQGGSPVDLRLLQLDIAVRDQRADATTGWVFGTFVYQYDAVIADPWERMVPVGLMWGNDPALTPAAHAQGVAVAESWINPAINLPHIGWNGRLNGPVDNPRSSCLSCHATAGVPQIRMTFPRNASDADRMAYFRNIPAGDPFRPQQASLDYSLQLAFGIRNFPPAPPARPNPISTLTEGVTVEAAEGTRSFVDLVPFPREGDEDLSPELDSLPLPGADLPRTDPPGGRGILWVWLLGGLVVGGAALLVILRRRKSPQEPA